MSTNVAYSRVIKDSAVDSIYMEVNTEPGYEMWSGSGSASIPSIDQTAMYSETPPYANT